MNTRRHTRNRLHELFAVEDTADHGAQLQQTVAAARAAYRSLRPRRRLSFWALIAKQFKFYALKLWLLQGMILSALCTWFLSVNDTTVILYDRHMVPNVLGLCGGIIALSAAPLMSRAVRCRMFELERSTVYSNRGILAAQFLFSGVGDVFMLTVLSLSAAKRQTAADEIFLYLIIPFLTAVCAFLMLLSRTAVRQKTLCLFLVCLFPAYLSCQAAQRTITAFCGTTPCGAPLLAWAVYALVCTGVLFWEGRRLFFPENTERLL